MSGRKVSKFQLKQERQRKLDLAQRVSQAHALAEKLKAQMAARLSGVSEGLRSTFAAEVARAEAWLGESLPDVSGLNADSGLQELQAMQTGLERAVGEGQGALEALTVALTRKADALGRRLALRVARAEALFSEHEDVLAKWNDEARMESWRRGLAQAKSQLEQEAYSALEPALDGWERGFKTEAETAREREEKHQKRLYLIKAVRQVCCDMGFCEVAQPKFEDPTARGSAMVFEVDTKDRGRITFSFTLDGISTFSEIADQHCFEEFDKLSEFLDEQFGIHTEFQMADGTPRPQLKEKSELELPADASKVQDAGQGPVVGD